MCVRAEALLLLSFLVLAVADRLLTRCDCLAHPQDFLLLSDVLGQAVPAGASATELAETLTVARVECERRRVTKSGKVKSKLSVVGVRCVDCAVRRRARASSAVLRSSPAKGS